MFHMIEIKRLLNIAYNKAASSVDPSTQNAALLVDDIYIVKVASINSFPNFIKETGERWERPLKYKIVEHAERNVCYEAARRGIKTAGLTMVCPWASCPDCARAIIQCGIIKLITHKQSYDRSPERWKSEIDFALDLLREAGIGIFMYDGKLDVDSIMHGGELWSP